MPADTTLAPCVECGMPCTPGEYHPYAACLMFKACHNSDTVHTNLEAVRKQAPAAQSTHAEECWSWGERHYGCALRKIESLQERVQELGRMGKESRNRAVMELERQVCDLQAARAPAASGVPLTPERVKEIAIDAGYDLDVPDPERAAFISGLRHGEADHGITERGA